MKTVQEMVAMAPGTAPGTAGEVPGMVPAMGREMAAVLEIVPTPNG